MKNNIITSAFVAIAAGILVIPALVFAQAAPDTAGGTITAVVESTPATAGGNVTSVANTSSAPATAGGNVTSVVTTTPPPTAGGSVTSVVTTTPPPTAGGNVTSVVTTTPPPTAGGGVTSVVTTTPPPTSGGGVTSVTPSTPVTPPSTGGPSGSVIVPNPTSTGSSSSSSSGGAGGSPVVINTTACLLAKPLRIGEASAEVLKLQAFLKNSQGLNVISTGVYDAQTVEAVKAFQVKYTIEVLSPWGISAPTGIAYLTTTKKINEIACNTSFSLTPAQLAEINAYKNRVTSGSTVTGQVGTSNPSTSPSTTVGSSTNSTDNTGDEQVGAAAQTSFGAKLWSFIKRIFGQK